MMGFFKDLLTPLKPCDVCRLGATKWTRDRTGVIDWSLRGGGLDASLLICPTCAEGLDREGLREKSPLFGFAVLVTFGVAERPPTEAFLQHPQWRTIWMHTLETMQLNVTDERDALDAMKRLEEQMFLEISQTRRERKPHVHVVDDDSDLPF